MPKHGFPYVVMEAKRAGRDLTDNDVMQARSYVTGPDFDRPAPLHMSDPSPALVLSPIRSANQRLRKPRQQCCCCGMCNKVRSDTFSFSAIKQDLDETNLRVLSTNNRLIGRLRNTCPSGQLVKRLLICKSSDIKPPRNR